MGDSTGNGASATKKNNIIGEKFGKLLVISESSERGTRNKVYYECRCDCGNNHKTSGESIKSGKSKSCGCLRKNPHNKNEDRVFAIKKQLYKTNIEKRSKKIELEYNISLEEYIEMIDKPCFYCGELKSNKAGDRFNTKKNERKTSDIIVEYNGIDRIDSNLGYLKSNTVTCCRFCNIAKNTMSQNQFKEWVIKVYTHSCIK